MTTTVTGQVENFHPGTTVPFTVTITHNGVVPNIVADSVTITFKLLKTQLDIAADLIATADCVTSGATGIAIFSLTPAQTATLTENKLYHYDIVWRLVGGAEYVLLVDTVKTLDRVSDA